MWRRGGSMVRALSGLRGLGLSSGRDIVLHVLRPDT